MFIQPDPVGPGQESVWDYPRPPRVEAIKDRLRVVHAGATVAETTAGFRVLETSHPPVYYFPPRDCDLNVLTMVGGSSFCEFKGGARYFDLKVPGHEVVSQVAWSYPQTTDGFRPIAGYLAFYAGKLDACWVGDDLATPQPGNFYGGWITPQIVGPFKGIPGSMGW
ncbi:MAG: DUF427 domain-containing protein [Planctomycetota bacterium]